MGQSWAVVGKGGTGKTTVSAFLLKYFIESGQTPILVVDADPNYNLNELLCVGVEKTIGDIREDLRSKIKDQEAAISKKEFFQYSILQSIGERSGFDYLVMGKSQGKGCYCYVNSLLKEILDKLKSSYKTVLIDCEAGLEHLSRGTTGAVDRMIMVSDFSVKGVETASRMTSLVDELGIPIGQKYLIVNRTIGEEASKRVEQWVNKSFNGGAKFLGIIPEDKDVLEYEQTGKNFLEFPNKSSAWIAFKEILCQIQL
jgi:CO dehydrogenase maturation factor